MLPAVDPLFANPAIPAAAAAGNTRYRSPERTSAAPFCPSSACSTPRTCVADNGVEEWKVALPFTAGSMV